MVYQRRNCILLWAYLWVYPCKAVFVFPGEMETKTSETEKKRIQFLRIEKLIREKEVRIGPDPDVDGFIKLLGELWFTSEPRHDDMIDTLYQAMQSWEILNKK